MMPMATSGGADNIELTHEFFVEAAINKPMAATWARLVMTTKDHGVGCLLRDWALVLEECRQQRAANQSADPRIKAIIRRVPSHGFVFEYAPCAGKQVEAEENGQTPTGFDAGQ